MEKEKKYKILIGVGAFASQAADALQKEVNSCLDKGYSVNGAPFLLSSDPNCVTLAQCVLKKD